MRRGSHRLQPTPIDEISRLPYFFMPDDELVPYIAKKRKHIAGSKVLICDDNHVWHERDTVMKLFDGQGEPLRKSRMQFTFRTSHNNYHDFYGGPALPKDVREMYGALVLQLADYIPPVSLDVRRATPKHSILKPEQIRRLQQSGEVYPESPGIVRSFSIGHILSQEVEISSTNRNFLLSDGEPAYDSEVMGAAARVLLSQIGESIPEETRNAYRHGYENQLISPEAPPTADAFMFNYMAGNLHDNIMVYAKALQDQVRQDNL